MKENTFSLSLIHIDETANGFFFFLSFLFSPVIYFLVQQHPQLFPLYLHFSFCFFSQQKIPHTPFMCIYTHKAHSITHALFLSPPTFIMRLDASQYIHEYGPSFSFYFLCTYFRAFEQNIKKFLLLWLYVCSSVRFLLQSISALFFQLLLPSFNLFWFV